MNSLIPAFHQFLQAYRLEHNSCGIILAACKQLSPASVSDIEEALQQKGMGLHMQLAYDKNTRLLAVYLEGQNRSETHFFSLQVKDILQERGLLAGSLLIASFSESKQATSYVLQRMIQEVLELAGYGEIKLFFHHLDGREETAGSILLVNHDETVNEFLQIFLQQKGYQVTIAQDGMDGVQKYQELFPDLVITDLNLPIMDGYQLMERIRQQQTGPASKIVVLTDKKLEEDVKKSFALGASDYITKPFSPVELAARVKRLIS